VSKFRKIKVITLQAVCQSRITNPACHIALQIAFTAGEAMKIAKFFRFLRPLSARERKKQPAFSNHNHEANEDQRAPYTYSNMSVNRVERLGA
jgi:hypothetical protein